jgi:hypothetical protein
VSIAWERSGVTWPAPWHFWIDDPWAAVVAAVPSEDHRTAYFQAAVPVLAAHGKPLGTEPLIIAGHISAMAKGRLSGGSAGRVKVFLDALHDDRRSGLKYRDIGAVAPLADDDPRHVGGLAIEVRAGSPQAQTRYLIGAKLRVSGQLLAEVPVQCEAPNDIGGSASERARITADRLAFGNAVRAAFTQCSAPRIADLAAVVVRHHPRRDEDNTWQTWITAVCGTAGSRGVVHWAEGAPLAGWRPTAIASIADTTIETPVRYELWR